MAAGRVAGVMPAAEGRPVRGDIGLASADLIRRVWEEQSGGCPIVSVDDRTYEPEDVEGLVWRDPKGEADGLVTFAVEGDRAEIVSLHAFVQGRGIGSCLMDAAEEELRRRGVRRVCLVTTNDNPKALSFYVRRGYRLVRLHLDAMDHVRKLKPRVPVIGNDGVPLRDMWELEREL
jgi:ribosomal protein S18 acetylase RimI-like enzyme